MRTATCFDRNRERQNGQSRIDGADAFCWFLSRFTFRTSMHTQGNNEEVSQSGQLMRTCCDRVEYELQSDRPG